MNLRKNNGYVGVDASIAVILLLIIIPTITGIIYNINKGSSSSKRKTEATNIAINTIEAIKGIGIDELNDKENSEIISEVKNKIDSLYNVNAKLEDNKIILTKNGDNTYRIDITITDYSQTDEGAEINALDGLVKEIRVLVEYRSGNKTENVDIKTAIS